MRGWPRRKLALAGYVKAFLVDSRPHEPALATRESQRKQRRISEMADFIYTTVPGKIKELLQKIREVGVPQKATVQWHKGFKSSNDASLLGVLKFIGFIDSSGVPTSKWSQYRGANHKSVLGEAIREGYADLFAVYSDANQRSQGDIDHVFSTSSSGGKQVIAKTVSTFKALAEQAEFAPVNEQTDL